MDYAKIMDMNLSASLVRRLTASCVASARLSYGEALRKSLHLLIALIPAIAAWDRSAALVFLAAGMAVYACAESLRRGGFRVPLISRITEAASRSRDSGRFVIGPLTLGAGALSAFLIFPEPASSLAVYAVAFGDGIAGVAGKLFGRSRPAWLCGKSVEGTAACFVAVALASWAAASDPVLALVVAASATFVEALPLGDWDNIAVPLAAGTVALLFLA